MNYFIDSIAILIIFLGAGLYKVSLKSWRYWIGILIILFGVYIYSSHKVQLEQKEYNSMIDTLTNLYEQKIDFLENKINTLSTDTITINEWKYYGDTIQYLGKDSIIMTYPVKYYRLIVTSKDSLYNMQINYKHYNDTIRSETKHVDNVDSKYIVIRYPNTFYFKYRRVVDGVVQFSFDGVNWITL